MRFGVDKHCFKCHLMIFSDTKRETRMVAVYMKLGGITSSLTSTPQRECSDVSGLLSIRTAMVDGDLFVVVEDSPGLFEVVRYRMVAV